jgi:hypothetical protein
LPGAVALETRHGALPGAVALETRHGALPGAVARNVALPRAVALKTRYMGFARGCRPKDTNEGLPPAKTRMMGCRPPDNDGRFTTGGGRYPLHPLTVTVYVGKACVGSGT